MLWFLKKRESNLLLSLSGAKCDPLGSPAAISYTGSFHPQRCIPSIYPEVPTHGRMDADRGGGAASVFLRIFDLAKKKPRKNQQHLAKK